jgi:hypothetical protein
VKPGERIRLIKEAAESLHRRPWHEVQLTLRVHGLRTYELDDAFDALVAPDHRVWRFSGGPEAPNTYQVLDSSSERLEALLRTDLQRVEAGLRRR